MLEEAGTSYLDALYEQILNTSFPNPTASEIRTLCSVLGAVVLAKAPFSLLSLSHLLSLKTSTIEHICNGLQSLVRSGDTLGFYHESFVDFLIDPSRSTSKFFIKRQQENRVLAHACLGTMNETLRFNICGLESSYIRNADVPDLSSRIEQHIPPQLSYSCSWWASHLAETAFDEGTFRALQNFMQKQFLFWLEILSIIQQVNLASRALLSLINWIMVRFPPFSASVFNRKYSTSSVNKRTQRKWQEICRNLSQSLPTA